MKTGTNGNELHHVKPLVEILETVLFTAALPETCPLSIIFVGPSGSAKSKLIKSYGGNYIHHTDSVSSIGLQTLVQRDFKNEMKFIFVPDINPTMTRKPATVNSTVGNLLSITADGTVRVDDGRGEKETKHGPVGLITACTPEIYERHAKQWFALGLRRRILPIFFRYSSGTISALQKLVRNGKIHSEPSKPVPYPIRAPRRAIRISSSVGFELQELSASLATRLGKLMFRDGEIKRWDIKDVTPIAPHITVRSLAIANAVKRHSNTVDKKDLEFVAQFVDFTDPETPKQI